MALGYLQISKLSANQDLLQQTTLALLKQALSRVGAATGPELALAQAIIKSPTTYATRFLLDALILNSATLSTADGGSTLSGTVTDAALDSAITSQWASQSAAGV